MSYHPLSTCRCCHVVFLGSICDDDDVYRLLELCVQKLESLVQLLRGDPQGDNQNDVVATLWIMHGLLTQAVAQYKHDGRFQFENTLLIM